MKKDVILLIVIMAATLGLSTNARAVTITWDGGGSTNNWSESANWSNDAVPGAGDDVVFGGISTKDATIDVPITVSSVQIGSGYIGTITQAPAASILVTGCSGRPCFLQNNGTFNGSANTITLVSGGFGALTLGGGVFNGGSGDISVTGAGDGDDNVRISGGTFTSTSGNLTLGRSLSLQNPGSQFLHNGGTVTFTAFNPGAAVVTDGDHPSIIFDNVNFDLGNGTNFSISSRMIVAGDLALNDGVLQGNGSVLEARGGVSISTNFDDSIATLELANGSGSRTFTFEAGLHLPKIVVNDTAVTINTSGSGTLTFPHQLILNAGVINQGGVDLALNAAGTGGGFCYVQNGGTFNGSGNTITANSNGFGAINVNGGTFNGDSGNINLVGTPADNPGLSLLGGTFRSTSGMLTVPGIFRFQGAGTSFIHNGGTVNFTAQQNTAITNDSEHPTIIFNDVTFNLGDGVNVLVGPRMIVLGSLALNDGTIGQNGSVLDARGAVSISPSFDGGNISLEFGPGAAPRTLTLAVGLNLPRIVLSDPNVTVNTSGAGTLLLPHQLIIHQGTFNQGNVDLTITPLDIGGGACLEMSGGEFNGSSHLLTLNSNGFGTVLMTGGLFNGGSGNIVATGDAINTNHDIRVNGGSFVSTSGTLFVPRAFRFQNSGTFADNGGTVVFDGGTTTAIVSNDGMGHFPPLIFHNVVFNRDAGSVIQLISTSIIVNGTLWLDDGVIDGAGGEVIEAFGDVNLGPDFDGITVKVTLVFAGGANQVVSLSGSQNFPGGWVTNKPPGSTVTVQVGGDLDLSSLLNSGGDLIIVDNGDAVIGLGSITSNSGSIDISEIATGSVSAASVTVATDGHVNVIRTPGAAISGRGAPDTENGPLGNAFGQFIVGGDIVNNGTMTIRGDAVCPGADTMLIKSSSPGTQRSWSGTGTFDLVNVGVQDQGGTAPIVVRSGTDNGNNGMNFTFDASCPVETPTATPTATPTPSPSCPLVTTPVMTSRSGGSGVPVTVPVNTTDLTGLGVISADFTFNYDPSVLSPNTADISVTPGTTDAGALINYNTSTAGSIVVSIFSTVEFTGAGTVADIHMKVIGPIGAVSPLTLTDFRYNGTLVCSTSSSGTLSVVSGTVMGRVSFENLPFPATTASPTPTPLPVPGTTITASGGTTFFTVSDGSGAYALSGFGDGLYTLTPSRPDESFTTLNGIHSNDASLIAQHVVGLITLDPTQIRAADVSGLHSISSFDAALIARWIVGLGSPPANQTGKWIFTPASTTPDTNIDSVQDYKALLMGDVNGDWSPTLSRPLQDASIIKRNSAIRISMPRVKAAPSETVELPLSVKGLSGIGVSSFEFNVEYDPAVIEPDEIAADLAGTNCDGFAIAVNSPSPGLLKVAVFGTYVVDTDGVFVNLRFSSTGGRGSSTKLNISDFWINDGTMAVVTEAGLLEIR